MRMLKQGGFTLIELMITLAIVTILTGVAYPSYVSHVRKGMRRAAQAQMLDIASREQQFLVANRSYVDYAGITGSGYALPPELGARYTPSIEVGTGTVPAFTITFTVTGLQVGDGSLTFTSEGVKGCSSGCDPATKW